MLTNTENAPEFNVNRLTLELKIYDAPVTTVVETTTLMQFAYKAPRTAEEAEQHCEDLRVLIDALKVTVIDLQCAELSAKRTLAHMIQSAIEAKYDDAQEGDDDAT